jgi:hypothetical protein
MSREYDHGFCVRFWKERSFYVCRFYSGIVLVGSLLYDAAIISVYATSGRELLVHCKGFGWNRPNKITKTVGQQSQCLG